MKKIVIGGFSALLICSAIVFAGNTSKNIAITANTCDCKNCICEKCTCTSCEENCKCEEKCCTTTNCCSGTTQCSH